MLKSKSPRSDAGPLPGLIDANISDVNGENAHDMKEIDFLLMGVPCAGADALRNKGFFPA